MGRREALIPDGPLREFAVKLRELRVNAPGGPTYRELARTAHYSASVLSVAAAGRHLPTWDVTQAYVTACGGDVDEWRERWTGLYSALQTERPDLITDVSPPPGPGGPAAASPEPDGPSAEMDGPPAIAPLTRSDPAKVGPFRLFGRLGGGAMGQVYLGVSKSGRPVAVKVVRPHLAEDPHFRRRFAAEVAAVRRVDSPYTPAVIDADSAAERPWMATAYIPGPSLGDVIDAAGPLAPDVVLGLAAGIADALAAVHAAGVLHRDLKPANVLLEATGPKVIDFGVAQAEDGSRMTQTGARVGTVPFMAPEQADGRPVTAAADIFALGSILAYAATGVLPFGDGTTGEVLYRIIHTPPDPAALDCGDDRLRTLITRCLDKDPERRPAPAQIIDACAGRRARTGWLPGSVRRHAERSVDDISALIAKATARRSASVRLRILAAAFAVVAVAVTAFVVTFTGGPGTRRPTAPVTPPHAWTATSGPSCATRDAVAMDTSGSWVPLPGSATGRCGAALIHRTNDSGAGANWVFYPGAGKTCTFAIDVPDSSAVTARTATYQAWETVPGQHHDDDRIGDNLQANQQAGRGKSITLTFGPTKNGTIDLQLYDNYPEHSTEVAGTVTATCR